ncbi:MAG: hypothetical protein PHT02_00920 [Tissierellia bacterium]|nr:hypothetical protein [Tissierellia bacterium]
MDKSKYGVHASHCCIKHGCKYGDKDCPVVNRKIKQEYLCEYCGEDDIKDLEQLYYSVDGFTKINPNKMYAKIKGAYEKDDKLVIINGYHFSGDVITLFLLHDEEKTISADKVDLLFKSI